MELGNLPAQSDRDAMFDPRSPPQLAHKPGSVLLPLIAEKSAGFLKRQ